MSCQDKTKAHSRTSRPTGTRLRRALVSITVGAGILGLEASAVAQGDLAPAAASPGAWQQQLAEPSRDPQQTIGTGLIVAGSLTTAIGFASFARPLSGDPCKGEVDAEARASCEDDQESKRQAARRRGNVVLPVGIAMVASGAWLVLSNQPENKQPQVEVFSDGEGIALAWRRGL